MWQRNLRNARDITINLEKVFDHSLNILLVLLNNFKSMNGADPVGLLLSLFTCVGHFCGNSTVNITNHITNLNLFLLLIGPSGMGIKFKKSFHNSFESRMWEVKNRLTY